MNTKTPTRILNAVSRPLAMTARAALPLLLAVCTLPPQILAQANDDKGAVVPSDLLETGRASKLAAAPASPAELKLVTYNIRWRGGEDLQKLIKLLGGDDSAICHASVIGLQEVDRHRQRTENANTARVMAEALGMYYAWAAPPQGENSDEEETGVAILSPYQLTEVERIVLPHEGPNKRRRVALGATVQIGETPVRVYSVHAETRMPVEKKIAHWRAVLEDLARYPKIARVVVLGDFNTIKEKDVKAARKLFTGVGFTTPFPDESATWHTFIIKLKLDWMWLRGLESMNYGVDKKVGMSDHWPLWAVVKMEKRGAPSPFPALPPSSPRMRRTGDGLRRVRSRLQ